MTSITTKKGDYGKTFLSHAGSVSKNNPYIQFVGLVDELVSFLGIARASSKNHFVYTRLAEIQRSLFDLASDMHDFGTRINDVFLYDFEKKHEELSNMIEYPTDFVLPGGRDSVTGGFIDMGRAMARKLEREFYVLAEATPADPQHNEAEIMKYLNRLSDHLWLLARLEEGDSVLR